MFSYNGNKRPTIAEIRAHPWMQADFDMKEAKQEILDALMAKKEKFTSESSREDASSRGDSLTELIK